MSGQGWSSTVEVKKSYASWSAVCVRKRGREGGREGGKVYDKENDNMVHVYTYVILSTHFSLLIPYPSSPLLLTLTLTPHSSPSPLPHLASLPVFSIVRRYPGRGRRGEWGLYLPPPSSWSLVVVHQTGSHEVGLSDLAVYVQVEEAEGCEGDEGGSERGLEG